MSPRHQRIRPARFHLHKNDHFAVESHEVDFVRPPIHRQNPVAEFTKMRSRQLLPSPTCVTRRSPRLAQTGLPPSPEKSF